MRVVRDFRFSTNVFGIDSGDGFAETCRRLEGFGYHTLFAADHNERGMPEGWKDLKSITTLVASGRVHCRGLACMGTREFADHGDHIWIAADGRSREDGWLLSQVWLQRFAYRQVFSLVLFKTLKRAIGGQKFAWDKLERTARMSFKNADSEEPAQAR